MIDKQDYYHGAAIVSLLGDERCSALKKKGLLGYVSNGRVFLFVKYTTKSRSPWQFTFDQEDVDRANRFKNEYERLIMVLVCGGDGICALEWEEAKRLLGNAPGRIAVARKHRGRYSVWGSADELARKVPLQRWPNLAFEAPMTALSAEKETE